MEYVEGTWNLVSCGGHLGPPATHSGTCSVVPWPSPAVREQGVGVGWDGWSWKASYVPSCGVELWGWLIQDSATFIIVKIPRLVQRQMAKSRRSFLPVLWIRGPAFSFCTRPCKLCSWPCLSHSDCPISPLLPCCFLLKRVDSIKTSCFPCFPAPPYVWGLYCLFSTGQIHS